MIFEKDTAGILAFSSKLSMGCYILFVMIILVNFFFSFKVESIYKLKFLPLFNFEGFLDLIIHFPIIVLAFGFQINAFPVYHCLENKSKEKMVKVV